jgi:hypothetical protein
MTTSPAAVIVTPTHCRRPSWKPKKRSASTARKTSPPERTACTIDSGASESAPTCRPHATMATIHPTKNHLERKRPTALRSGWRTRIGGASTAPRCLNRNATLVASAEASARISPRIMVRCREGGRKSPATAAPSPQARSTRTPPRHRAHPEDRRDDLQTPRRSGAASRRRNSATTPLRRHHALRRPTHEASVCAAARAARTEGPRSRRSTSRALRAAATTTAGRPEAPRPARPPGRRSSRRRPGPRAPRPGPRRCR